MKFKRLRIGKLKNLGFWWFLVVAVMAAGVAVRLFYAWTQQYLPNADHGLVNLMAKHMAEGRDFPTFFYGQPYMGSLEPAISAVLVRMFGATGLMVCLGTALTGCLMLPLIYLYGRDAESRWAGLLALIYGLVGSRVSLYFSVGPRGGYMTMLVCGFAALWLACRIATQVHRGHPVSAWAYTALGLLAGLGWWSDQLVVPFLLTACAVLVIGFRVSMLTRGLIPALVGFALGSLPWWLWNVTHDWGSFDFTSAFGRVTTLQGLQCFWVQFLSLAGLDPAAGGFQKARIVLLLVALAGFAALVIRDRLTQRDAGRFYYRAGLLILSAAMLVLFVRSRYCRFDGASRYLMPLVPALAVMVGVVCARILVWRYIPFGVLLLAAVMPPHTVEFHRARQTMERNRVTYENARRLADVVAPQCKGIALGDWVLYHWMNFASSEKLRIAFLPTERYTPYAREAELAESPAVIGDFKQVRDFLETTGGTSTRKTVDGVEADVGICPPPDTWQYVEPSRIESVADSTGTLAAGTLMDLCLDTTWDGNVLRQTNVSLTLSFRESLPVCGLRLLSPIGRYPSCVSIEVQSGGRTDWQPWGPARPTTCYFWSDRSLKCDGMQYFQEMRFAPPTNGVRRLRLTFTPGTRETHCRFDLGEVRVLAEGPPAGERPAVDACVAALREQHVKRLYAPRRLAGPIWLATQKTLDVSVPGNLRRTVHDITVRDLMDPEPVTLHGTTGFICDRRDADDSRRVLRDRGLIWHETALGSHVLLAVPAPGESLQAGRVPTLYWTDLGCFGADLSRFAKEAAHHDFLAAQRLTTAGRAADAGKLLERAVQTYPGHQPASEALAALLRSTGHPEAARSEELRLKALITPGVPAHVTFANGVELLGVSMATNRVTRGGCLDVTYYWKAPASVFNPDHPVLVFTHCTRQSVLIQKEHRLLASLCSDLYSFQPFPDIFTESQRLSIPPDAAPGVYRMMIGLYDARTKKRFRPSTGLPQDHHAVQLPLDLQIVPSE